MWNCSNVIQIRCYGLFLLRSLLGWASLPAGNICRGDARLSLSMFWDIESIGGNAERKVSSALIKGTQRSYFNAHSCVFSTDARKLQQDQSLNSYPRRLPIWTSKCSVRRMEWTVGPIFLIPIGWTIPITTCTVPSKICPITKPILPITTTIVATLTVTDYMALSRAYRRRGAAVRQVHLVV